MTAKRPTQPIHGPGLLICNEFSGECLELQSAEWIFSDCIGDEEQARLSGDKCGE